MGTTELSDEAIEAFFLGDAHGAWEQDPALVSLAEHVATGATGPPPRPSAALAELLGRPSQSPATAQAHNVVPLFRRLRLTAGIAAAAGVAAAALTVAGTAGVLPDPAMRAVAWVVEAVTPFELPEPSGSEPVAERGPMSTAPPSTAGPSPTGQDAASEQPSSPQGARPGAQPGVPGVGVAPGPARPATPPGSVPAGTTPVPIRPSGTDADFRPLVPSPQAGISPPAGGSADSPSTTVVDRPRQAPGGAAARPSVAGSPPPR